MTAAGPTPVGGALVQETVGRRSGRTDAEGRYQIGGVPLVSSTTIAASKSGYVTVTLTRAIAGDTTVDIELNPRTGYTLTGVISEMTPTGPVGIQGVGVSFLSYISNDEYADGETATDDQGRYRLTGVWGPEAYTGIWLVKAGYRIDPQRNPPCDLCFRTLVITGDTVFDVQLERLPNTVIGSLGRLQSVPLRSD
jgi:hypothetical protein